jgi:ankyrin repeat protein
MLCLMPGFSSAVLSDDPVDRHPLLGLDLETKDKNGNTALMDAARFACHDICDLLIDHGANIDASDLDGETALFDAVNLNNHVTIQFLIDRGASCTVLDRDGHSILYRTATRADVHTMGILQKARIDGLFMDPSAITEYWEWFERRDVFFRGERAPLEEETAAFQALLESIIPCSDPQPPPPSPPNEHDSFDLPGVFPLDSGG